MTSSPPAHRAANRAPDAAIGRRGLARRAVRTLATLLLACTAATRLPAQEVPGDSAAAGILIRGGTVVDGTGAPGRRLDVRVRGDRIVELGPSLAARPDEQVIDATGLTVTPGFVDLHSHASRALDQDSAAESVLRQGITTVVVGQDGSSELPVSDFLERVDRVRPAVNFATMVGHGTVRSVVLGADFRRAATAGEVETMRRLVDRAMRDGAVGLSSGTEYDPGFYAEPAELEEVARALRPHGGVYASHVRDEENGVLDAWREVVDLGRRTGVPVHLSHAKLASAPVWGKAEAALAILETAARDGVRVSADWYPYAFWSSSMYVLLPDRDFENRDGWARALDEIGGAQNVLVTGYDPDTSWNGRTLAELAQARGSDPVTTAIEMMRRAGPGIGIMATAMDERDMERFAADPRVLFASDGSPTGAHPRGYGAFPRVLGTYVRERGVVGLAEAVRKMSGAPAGLLGLADRGTIAPGKLADLVVLDPAVVADRGTKLAPSLPPVGIRWVLVNGQPVLADGAPTGRRPGRAVRGGGAAASAGPG